MSFDFVALLNSLNASGVPSAISQQVLGGIAGTVGTSNTMSTQANQILDTILQSENDPETVKGLALQLVSIPGFPPQLVSSAMSLKTPGLTPMQIGQEAMMIKQMLASTTQTSFLQRQLLHASQATAAPAVAKAA